MTLWRRESIVPCKTMSSVHQNRHFGSVSYVCCIYLAVVSWSLFPSVLSSAEALFFCGGQYLASGQGGHAFFTRYPLICLQNENWHQNRTPWTGCTLLTRCTSDFTVPAAATASRTKASYNRRVRRCGNSKVCTGLLGERTYSAWTEANVTWKGRSTEVHGGKSWCQQVR